MLRRYVSSAKLSAPLLGTEVGELWIGIGPADLVASTHLMFHLELINR